MAHPGYSISHFVINDRMNLCHGANDIGRHMPSDLLKVSRFLLQKKIKKFSYPHNKPRYAQVFIDDLMSTPETGDSFLFTQATNR